MDPVTPMPVEPRRMEAVQTGPLQPVSPPGTRRSRQGQSDPGAGPLAARLDETSPAQPPGAYGLPIRSLEILKGQRQFDSSAPEGEESVFAPPGEEREELTSQEQRELDDLERRDREIRAHEKAHRAAAGGYAHGGIHYEYQLGPDGKSYAVGGDVDIQIADESTPERTAQKMAQIRAAALAPANPSPQDRRVALQARIRENDARRQVLEEKTRRSGLETRAPEPAPVTEEDSPDIARRAAGDRPGRMLGELLAGGLPDRLSGPVPQETDGPIAGPGPNPAGVAAIARRASAIKAYAEQTRPAPLRPDTRSMQPGYPQQSGFGAVTTLEPPEGSSIEEAGLGR